MASRNLYLLFVAACVITLFGFWPSFYSLAGGLDGWRIAHGVFATAWSLLLIAPVWLIGRRRLGWHRTLGWTSLVVAPGLVLVTFGVFHSMLVGGAAGSAPFPRDLKLALAFIDITSIALFALLYGLAMLKRKVWPLHARYMASTALIAFPPALGRAFGMNIPAMGGLAGSLDPSFWVADAVLVALIAYDARKGRVLPPYPLTLAAFVAIELCMWRAPEWAWFVGAMQALGLPPT